LATGCGGLGRRSSAELVAAHPLPAHTGPVFLTESGWPANHPAACVAKLHAGTASEEPTETVLVLLAQKAREVGANAVVELKIWRQGSGLSWKAPQGSGLALRIADTNAVSAFNGYWR
jgi:hypothetical protein